MTDLLMRIRAEIDARMKELAPAVAEYEQLTTAAGALVAEGRAARAPRQRRGRAAAEPDASGSVPAAPAPGSASTKPKARAGGARRAREGRVRGGRGPTGQSPASQAILAALEHGSHTVAELVLVTALSPGDIREALRQLRARKAIVKTERDGKAAYAQPAG